MSTIVVPSGSVVKFSGSAISDDMKTYSNDNKYCLSEDLQLTLHSTFTKLVDETAPKFFKALAGVTRDLFGVSMSGEYKQLGLQIWDSTDPLSLSFSVDLVMRMDAKKDVFLPMTELIQLPLPEDKGGIQGLVPPGPSILTAFGSTKSKSSAGGVVNLAIGGLVLVDCIVTGAEPVISRYPASPDSGSTNYPIYAKVQVSVESSFTATREMIRSLMTNKMSNS
jgi:hypothetical protein